MKRIEQNSKRELRVVIITMLLTITLGVSISHLMDRVPEWCAITAMAVH